MRSSSICRSLVLLAALTWPAAAIDPGRALSQYLRDRWSADRGFPNGPVYSISQTADGYLWIGTESGLVRFDGITFHPIEDSTPGAIAFQRVLGVFADPDNNLWVREQGLTLRRYAQGRFENVMTGQDWAYSDITAMTRGRDGRLLLWAMENDAVVYRDGRFTTVASARNLPRSPVIALAQTGDGDLWLGTRDAGLFRLHNGVTTPITENLPDMKINCLLAVGDHELLVGTDHGIARWDGARLRRDGLPAALGRVQTLALASDRDGNIWIGTDSLGLLRLRGQDLDAFPPEPGRAPNAVTAVFEDREGNIWSGSARGLERLRDSVFMTYSIPEGLPSESNGPVYAGAEGATWFAPVDGGLYRLEASGRVEAVTAAGLNRDVVYSIAGGEGELWAARQRGGLTRLGPGGPRTYTTADGLAQNSVFAVHRQRDGTVWAGTLSGGVTRLAGGKLTTFTEADGLASNSVQTIVETAAGDLWFGTAGGLSLLRQGRWTTYRRAQGLPADSVFCLLEDRAGTLWAGTPAGLAYLANGRFRTPPGAAPALTTAILGLAEDPRGDFWIATSRQVLRASRPRLLSGPASGLLRDYGPADGLHGVEGVRRHRSVIRDARGRIWLCLNRGLSVVDPDRLGAHSEPAIVRIEEITADGVPLDNPTRPRFAAGTRRLAFSYAGLSLTVPERVRFRYRLDGFDQDWSEAVPARQAVYTNLNPGPYRFQVVASNPDGLWNSAPATVSFEVQPAYWQTVWFRAFAAAALVLGAIGLYRLRVRQMTQHLQLRFDERLAERTRIAQELHDTLLQGLLSASMQLHVAVDRLPPEAPEKPALDRVLALMSRVIEEGRHAVRGLRLAHPEAPDLADALARVEEDLETGSDANFRIIVEGHARPLHPVPREEIYRIGREALTNAFRHARANTIEVELEYADAQFRLLIRDNGVGIDTTVLATGREGHWGLAGMRERAERIGARFHLWSSPGAGTEVVLTVPGEVAYPPAAGQQPVSSLARRLALLTSRSPRTGSTP